MNSYGNRKLWDGIEMAVASAAGTAAWGNWVDRDILQNTICDKNLQSLSSANRAYCWVALL